MAEWTNLFDLGECTVKVFDPGFFPPEEVFSQVMVKGQSEEFVYSFETNNIAVGVDGSVSGDGPLFGSTVMVAVVPSYDHAYPARVIDCAFDAAHGSAKAGIHDVVDGTPAVDYIAFSSVAPASPDPLDLSSLTSDNVGVFVYAQPGA